MRLLIDMNLSRTWMPYLAQAGFEAIHWADVGNPKALDHEIMAFARQNGFSVFTRDLDFGELLALNNSLGPSVVQLRGGDPMPEVSGTVVVSALNGFREKIEGGALVTISLARARVRVLPLRKADR